MANENYNFTGLPQNKGEWDRLNEIKRRRAERDWLFMRMERPRPLPKWPFSRIASLPKEVENETANF